MSKYNAIPTRLDSKAAQMSSLLGVPMEPEPGSKLPAVLLAIILIIMAIWAFYGGAIGMRHEFADYYTPAPSSMDEQETYNEPEHACPPAPERWNACPQKWDGK